MKPEPEPLDPARLPELARETMAAARFPMLATADGDQPRLRPVSPVLTDGFVVYVASLQSSHKTGEIEANRRVELCYLAPNHDQVRITGRAEDLTDPEVLGRIWEGNPLLRQFVSSTSDPELLIYRIVPSRVRFMREWALEYYEVPVENL